MAITTPPPSSRHLFNLAEPGRLDPDFVPTPASIAHEMCSLVGLKKGPVALDKRLKVLEPSAGTGDIARIVREYPVDLDVIELDPGRRAALEDQGFRVVGDDFTQFAGPNGEGYDAIVMNPPFSKKQAVQHIKHAFSLLKPGGKLASILPEYWFRGSKKPQREFHAWLQQASQGLWSAIPLVKEVFINDRSQVDIATRILVMQKPAALNQSESTVEKSLELTA